MKKIKPNFTYNLDSLKTKLLLPTTIIILISMFAVGITGYLIQRSSTYDLVEALLTDGLNDFENNISVERRNAERARMTVNANLITLAKSIDSQLKYISDGEIYI